MIALNALSKEARDAQVHVPDSLSITSTPEEMTMSTLKQELQARVEQYDHWATRRRYGPEGHNDRRLWVLACMDERLPVAEALGIRVDTPAGGGPGMVMRADILGDAIDAARDGLPDTRPMVYMSPRGKRFDQDMAQSWLDAGGVTILCGRFEGVDERVLEARNVEEVSLGE